MISEFYNSLHAKTHVPFVVPGEEQTAPHIPYVAEAPVVAGIVPPSESLSDIEGPKIGQAMFCETIPLPLTSEADFLHTN